MYCPDVCGLTGEIITQLKGLEKTIGSLSPGQCWSLPGSHWCLGLCQGRPQVPFLQRRWKGCSLHRGSADEYKNIIFHLIRMGIKRGKSVWIVLSCLTKGDWGVCLIQCKSLNYFWQLGTNWLQVYVLLVPYNGTWLNLIVLKFKMT